MGRGATLPLAAMLGLLNDKRQPAQTSTVKFLTNIVCFPTLFRLSATRLENVDSGDGAGSESPSPVPGSNSRYEVTVSDSFNRLNKVFSCAAPISERVTFATRRRQISAYSMVRATDITGRAGNVRQCPEVASLG